MSARGLSWSLGLGLGLLLSVGAPGAARASARYGSRYDPFEGYGTHSLRAGLTGDVGSGTLPSSGGATYVQKSLVAEFNVLAFSSPTVFGTLLGIEFDMAAGIRTVDAPSVPAGTNEAIEGVGFTMKADIEFAYDLVRWKIHALRQRLILNAGGGVDYNAHPWTLLNGSEGWRAYPLLGGHVQSWIGESLLLDVAYRYVPTQSKDDVGSEHRAQASLGIGPVMVGVNYSTTQLLKDPTGPLPQTRLGIFAAYAF